MNLINISILGSPNVGKSTLINKLLKNKVSIVSNLPQTTRVATNFYLNYENFALKIWDTPGIHKPINKLDLFLNSEVYHSFKQADLVILIVNCLQNVSPELQQLIDQINTNKNLKTILIYSKIDLLQDTKTFETLKNSIDTIIHPDQVLQMNFLNDDITIILKAISNLFKDNITELEEVSQDDLVEQEQNDDNFKISEIIREQILKHTYQEVPHSVAVTIEHKEYDQVKNLFHVNANIVVEKEGQKAIIIGKGGLKIKQIGVHARQELLNLFDCKINLKLFCKVQKDWRNNDYLIKSLGYKKWR
ncbi:GTPase Era [[Mycoplasma] testudinis]|uniref:GTPase Era n=1 Tax=[Mycoplasma] testudinis TaxID=33924 RepID=UPI000488CC98|nr:GTPase Era [[Mycoplasma] testudinis]